MELDSEGSVKSMLTLGLLGMNALGVEDAETELDDADADRPVHEGVQDFIEPCHRFDEDEDAAEKGAMEQRPHLLMRSARRTASPGRRGVGAGRAPGSS